MMSAVSAEGGNKGESRERTTGLQGRREENAPVVIKKAALTGSLEAGRVHPL